MNSWLFYSFSLLFKCAFTAIISWGGLFETIVWRVPGKLTDKLLFFRSSLSPLFPEMIQFDP